MDNKGETMAKYSYKYLCGHGYGTVNLYGKESERQRKLAWYADTFVCPECFKKQKAEEDAAAPKTASLHLAVYGGVYQSIQVHGQLAANKEALKQLGYRWGDDLDGGLLAFLRTPKRALQKWTLVESIDDIKRTAKQWADELAELGYKITAVPGLMDQQGARAYFDYAAEKAAEEQRKKEEEQRKKEAAAKAEAEKQEKIRRLDPKPNPPEWYKQLCESKKYWNGKFYGDDKRGWRIYLDGHPTKVTRENKELYEKWCSELKEWQEFWKD